MADISKRLLDCNDDCEGERGERGKRGKRGRKGEDGERGHDGKDGHDGHDGHTGPTGPGGATGFTGPAGATGFTGPGAAAGNTTIIPFASGTPVALSAFLDVETGALLETCALIAFGDSAPVPIFAGQPIDLDDLIAFIPGGLPLPPAPLPVPPVPGSLLEMSWTMPRAGTLLTLSGFYTNAVGIDVLPPGVTNVTLQLYHRPASDLDNTNDFRPLEPELVLQPGFSGLIALGDTADGFVDLGGIPVARGDRLVLVACVEGTAPNLAAALTGYISAGLEIGPA